MSELKLSCPKTQKYFFRPPKTEGYTEAENELQVGDDVQIENISGQLMCSSKMGVDCLDLLNHVLTDESDLRAFLGSENCDEVWA